jgi:hypothetical protein
MRWGVREDASVEHTTTEMCLHEIANCQRESAGPNFVVSLACITKISVAVVCDREDTMV